MASKIKKINSFIYSCQVDLYARVNGFVQFTRCCASHFHGAFFADTTITIQPNYNYVVNYRPEVTLCG